MQAQMTSEAELETVLQEGRPEIVVTGALARAMHRRLRLRRIASIGALALGAIGLSAMPITGGLSAVLAGLTAAEGGLALGLTTTGTMGVLGWRAISTGYDVIEVSLDLPRLALRRRWDKPIHEG